jgi:chromate transporter
MTKPAERTVRRVQLRLFTTFFRIGLFTFGGGYAMLPLIEREMTETKKWIKPDELIDMIALAQSLPGPVAVNASVFIGRHMAGASGAFAAMVGCTLPSLLVILAIAMTTATLQENPYVQQFFNGVLASVTALILLTALKMGRRAIHDYLTGLLALIATVLVAFFNVHALLVILGGAAIGFLLYWVHPGLVQKVTGVNRQNQGTNKEIQHSPGDFEKSEHEEEKMPDSDHRKGSGS